jgi:hypothetical protein
MAPAQIADWKWMPFVFWSLSIAQAQHGTGRAEKKYSVLGCGFLAFSSSLGFFFQFFVLVNTKFFTPYLVRNAFSALKSPFTDTHFLFNDRLFFHAYTFFGKRHSDFRVCPDFAGYVLLL